MEFPPRFWWLKRLTLAGVMLVSALITLRVSWGWYAERKLARAIAEIRSRGEPVTAEDITWPPLPDPQNAAIAYEAAARAASRTAWSPRNSNFEYKPYPPMSAKWWAAAQASFEANTRVFELAAQAQKLHDARWPQFDLFTFNFGAQRSLASILADASAYQHHCGNDEAALKLVATLIHQADMIERGSGLVGYLTAVGVFSLATDELFVIAPAFSLTAEQRGMTQPVRPATREQITMIIATLLDDSRYRDALVSALVVDRTITMTQTQPAVARVSFLRPMYEMDLARALIAPTTLINDLRADGRYRGNAAPSPARAAWIEHVRPLSTFNYDARDRIHRRDAFVRRAAAITLAANCFRVDFNRWPVDLNELVPAYLPAVPADPFRADGGVLSYAIINGVRPIVFSVGQDGVADAVPSPPAEPSYGSHFISKTKPTDLYRDLSRFSP